MMRRVLLALIVVFLGEIIPAPAKGAQIWSDGFESGNFGAWNSADPSWTVVTSSLAAHAGLKGADAKGPTSLGGDVLSVGISSAGFQNLQWQFWFKVRDALEPADSVAAQWTANGADWITLSTYSNLPAGDWQFASFSLPDSADENPSLAFRFKSILGGATDRMNFDDVELSGVASVPEPSGAFLFGLSALSLLRRKRA